MIGSLAITDNYLVIDGTLSIASGLTLGTGGEVDLAGSLAFGSLTNADGIDIQGSGQISSAGTIDNQGQIAGGGLTLDFPGLINDGTLIAVSGALDVNLTSNAAGFANLSGGTLSLGTYGATQGTLDLNVAAAIVDDAANIILTGGSSTTGQAPMIATFGGVGGTATPITQTLQTIASNGTLTLQQADFAGTTTLLVDGLLQLDGGTLTTPGLTIAPGGTVAGTGMSTSANTVNGPILNNGVIAVERNTSGGSANNDLVLAGAVSGTGTLEIRPSVTMRTVNDMGGQNTLEVGGPCTNAIDFGDWNGVLQLDSPGQFAGTIAGFTIGVNTVTGRFVNYQENSDAIIVSGVNLAAITGVNYTGNSAGGTLTLQEAGGTIALDFVGDYAQSDFRVTSGPQLLSSLPPSVEISEVPLSISGALAGQAGSDQAAIAPFSNVTIADVSDQTEAVTVTLSNAANGTLSNLGGGGYNATTGVYTVTGDTAQVTAALRDLVFTPTANDVTPGQTIATTFIIGATDTAGATTSDTTTSVLTTSTTPPTTSGLLGDLTTNQQLELIYVAYVDRAADGAGLAFWNGQNVQAQGAGQSAALALTNIANAFAPQPETEALYPFLNTPNLDFSTQAAQSGLVPFINGVYENLFDRTSDPVGEAYCIGQLTSGAVGPGAAALTIGNGALNADATEVRNKIAVALDFTNRTSTAGLGTTAPLASSFVTAARSVLSGVDGASLNDASVMAGMNATTNYISNPNSSQSTALGVNAGTGTPLTIAASNSVIDSGAGNFTIQFLAGASADTLVLHADSLDQLSGFDPTTDVLDLGTLLSEANVARGGNAVVFGNFLTVTDRGANALLHFDPSGHGGGSTIAVLRGLGSVVTSLDTLVAQGAIRIDAA